MQEQGKIILTRVVAVCAKQFAFSYESLQYVSHYQVLYGGKWKGSLCCFPLFCSKKDNNITLQKLIKFHMIHMTQQEELVQRRDINVVTKR